jgi:hypothetical protein
MANSKNDLLCCSFCHKSQHEVKKLIAGAADVFICDECIELCNDIVRQELASSVGSIGTDGEGQPKLPAPREIAETLNQYVIGQDSAKRVWLSLCTIITNVCDILELVRMMWNWRRAISCLSVQRGQEKLYWRRH